MAGALVADAPVADAFVCGILLPQRAGMNLQARYKSKGAQRVCPFADLRTNLRLRFYLRLFRRLGSCGDACCGGGCARCDERGADDANEWLSCAALKRKRWFAIQLPGRVTAVWLRSAPELKQVLLLRKDGSQFVLPR